MSTWFNAFEYQHLPLPLPFDAANLNGLSERLGGDGKAPGDLRTRIGSAFGTFDAWESEFREIGQGLGGGSGWVVLGYNTHLKILEN